MSKQGLGQMNTETTEEEEARKSKYSYHIVEHVVGLQERYPSEVLNQRLQDATLSEPIF